MRNYKFTGVTEIQCWTLQGENPGSPRNEDCSDKLEHKAVDWRYVFRRSFRSVWLVAAAGPNRSQTGSRSGLLRWLYSTAIGVVLSQREGVLRTLPTDGPSWGHRPQRMLAASTGEAGGGKWRWFHSPPPPSWPLDPADGGAGKPSSEMKAAHGSVFPFSGKLTVPETMPPGRQGLSGEGSGFSDQ